MANSVTFPLELGGNGQTYTDDADPDTGLDGLGHAIRFVPCLQQAVAMGLSAKNDAAAASSFKQQCQTLRQEVGEDRQAVAEDRAAVAEHLQDAQARIGTTQALIDARDTALGAQAGAEDAEAGAVAAQTGAEAARDAAVVSGQVYPDTSTGLAATSDEQYFKTVAANQAGFLTLWRNDSGAATEIETYPSLTGIAQALQQANRKQTRLARSLQRLGDHGQTLHSDFDLDAHGLGTSLVRGVQDALDSDEMWTTVERATPEYALQHTSDGSLKYVEVPPNTIAREYNPGTGEYQMQSPLGATNTITDSKLATRNASDYCVKGPSTILADETVNNLTVGDSSDPSRSYLYLGQSGQTGTFTVSCVIESEIDEGDFIGSLFAVFRTSESALTSNGGYDPLKGFPQRVSFTFSSVNGVSNVRIGVGTVTNAVGVMTFSLPQLVQGSSPGPVIPTDDTPVTVDNTSVSRERGAEFNQSEGTFYIEFDEATTSTTLGGISYVSIIGSSVNDQIAVYLSGGFYAARYRTNGVTRDSQNVAFTAGSRVKASVAWSKKLNQILVSINGQAAAVSEFFELPAISNINIGGYVSTGFESDTPINVIQFLSEALSSAEIQELTAL